MLSGTRIDDMVTEGAYNLEQLSIGDVILEVDGGPETAENMQEVLLGADVPGTQFVMKVRKPGAGRVWGSDARDVKSVVLAGMTADVIADRQRMLRVFTDLKVNAF